MYDSYDTIGIISDFIESRVSKTVFNLIIRHNKKNAQRFSNIPILKSKMSCFYSYEKSFPIEHLPKTNVLDIASL